MDVGGSGRRDDGNVYHRSVFGRMLQDKKLNIPPPCKAEGVDSDMPFFFIGDAAFEKCQNLLNPFRGTTVPPPERIFNYRLSRARQTIEDTFGLLFQSSLDCSVTYSKYITLACCVLHNLHLMDEDSVSPLRKRLQPELYQDYINHDGKMVRGRWKNENEEAERKFFARLLDDLERSKEKCLTEEKTREEIRELLLDYFIENPLPWQWKRAGVE